MSVCVLTLALLQCVFFEMQVISSMILTSSVHDCMFVDPRTSAVPGTSAVPVPKCKWTLACGTYIFSERVHVCWPSHFCSACSKMHWTSVAWYLHLKCMIAFLTHRTSAGPVCCGRMEESSGLSLSLPLCVVHKEKHSTEIVLKGSCVALWCLNLLTTHTETMQYFCLLPLTIYLFAPSTVRDNSWTSKWDLAFKLLT